MTENTTAPAVPTDMPEMEAATATTKAAVPDHEPTAAVPEPTAEFSPTPAPSPTETIEIERGLTLTAERATIEANVSEIRGWEAQQPVVVTVLNTEQLRQRIENDLLEDYGPEEARRDVIVLSAFDFLAPDFDLYTMTLDLFTEEIAGFYDTETDEFVIVSNDDVFDTLEKLTHAHEFTHALQDQRYDLAVLEDDSVDSEAKAALSALAEGDASLVQMLYMMEGYLSQEDLMSMLGEAFALDTPVLDSAPPILVSDLMFPYIEGLNFVQYLYDRGGFEAVDKAWAAPPVSTEHILHPERYLAGDEPVLVNLLLVDDILGEAWEIIDDNIMGEFYLREYLAQQLPIDQAETAAEGWGGDSYVVYWNESEQSLISLLRVAWDETIDEVEFYEALSGYMKRKTGDLGKQQPDGGTCWFNERATCFYPLAGDSLVVQGPDLDSVQALALRQK